MCVTWYVQSIICNFIETYCILMIKIIKKRPNFPPIIVRYNSYDIRSFLSFFSFFSFFFSFSYPVTTSTLSCDPSSSEMCKVWRKSGTVWFTTSASITKIDAGGVSSMQSSSAGKSGTRDLYVCSSIGETVSRSIASLRSTSLASPSINRSFIGKELPIKVVVPTVAMFVDGSMTFWHVFLSRIDETRLSG